MDDVHIDALNVAFAPLSSSGIGHCHCNKYGRREISEVSYDVRHHQYSLKKQMKLISHHNGTVDDINVTKF